MLRTFFFVFAAGLILVVPQVVQAETPDAHEPDPARFTMRAVNSDEPYFVLSMDPGEEREITVELRNIGGSTGTADLYAADVFSLINGGFGARKLDDAISGTTEWLDIESDSVELYGGERIQRSFTVSVPDDATPGEHITSLVFQNREATPMEQGNGFSLNQIARHAIAVLIDVPGPRDPALSIGDVGHEPGSQSSTVQIEVDNPGNVRLYPSGRIRLEHEDGEIVSERDIEMGVIYAGHQTHVEFDTGTELAPGDYRVWLTLTDDATGVTASIDGVLLRIPDPVPVDDPVAGGTSTDSRLPGSGGTGSMLWLIGMVAAVSGLVASLAVVVRRRRRARETGEPETTPVEHAESTAGMTPAPIVLEPASVAESPPTTPRIKPLLPPRSS